MEVEASLSEVENEAGIDEARKDTLQATFKQAAKLLKQAEGFASKSANYMADLATAPKKTLESRELLKSLPTTEQAGEIGNVGSYADTRKELDAQQATLQTLSDDLERVAGELLKTEGRPIEIGARLPEAQRELRVIRNRWEKVDQNATSLTAKAERFLIQAEYTRLIDEIEMMRQEQVSQSVRDEELTSRRDLLTRQVENLHTTIDHLSVRLKEELASDVDRIRSLAEVSSEDLPDDVAVQELAAEVQRLAEQFEAVVNHLKQVTPAMRQVKDQFDEVSSEYRDVRKELSLGSGDRELAQVLLELSRRAQPSALTLQVPISVEGSRLDLFSVKRMSRGQSSVEARFADHSSAVVEQLVAARREILDRLRVESTNLTQALVNYQIQKQQYLDLCGEIQAYVSNTLFGFTIRSCPSISFDTLTGIPAGLAWLFRAEHWAEMGKVLSSRQGVMIAAAVLTAFLLLLRRRLIAALKATGLPIRRISTDRYSWTGKALFWTTLLATPLPLFVGITSWVLNDAPNPSDWMMGFTDGMYRASGVLVVVVLMIEICRPGGLGISHFRWSEKIATRASRMLKFSGVAYTPMILLVFSTSFGEASRYADSVGRAAFILAHAWVAFVLWQFLQSTDELSSQSTDSTSRFLRLCIGIRYPFLLGAPMALITLACIGYLITAVDLSYGLVISAGIVAGGLVLLRTTTRWFEIRQRRLALAEALEKRRARLAAATEEVSEDETDELLQLDEEEELGLDLDVAGDQTFAFLRLFFNLGILIVLYSYWSSVVPLAAALDAIPLPLVGGLSVLSMVKAVIVSIVTIVAVRNLPGLLEVSVLRKTKIEAGTRNAIYTLCQYGVVGLALIAISAILELDWSQLGWMAAALSVGLGFGLQEVVANFVCGLILLFERPISVGDVVTIDGTTGTVSNINMRATTITNWDRQDL
ncbi:MAG: mechanosensitive ion channel domain-containing protein, partial [Bythopirellula sp.]